MDLMATAAVALLAAILLGVWAGVKRKGWKKVLGFAAIGLVCGFVVGYLWLAPFIISFV